MPDTKTIHVTEDQHERLMDRRRDDAEALWRVVGRLLDDEDATEDHAALANAVADEVERRLR